MNTFTLPASQTHGSAFLVTTQKQKDATALIQAHTADELFQKTIQLRKLVTCIIIDLTSPLFEGFKAIEHLKSHFMTAHIPVIVLVELRRFDDIKKAIEVGADDYLQKPFELAELETRITMNLRKTERDQNANPLTKLPGNGIINRLIAERLHQNLAVLYIDIDHFKAYNDAYGFDKGDEVLIKTADVICSCIQKSNFDQTFLGHIGGDDFVVITTPQHAQSLASQICTTFDTLAPDFYNQTDQQRRSIIVPDRRNIMQEYPLMTLSIAIVHNERRKLTSIALISQIASELKAYAKTKPGGGNVSMFVVDRRNGL